MNQNDPKWHVGRAPLTAPCIKHEEPDTKHRLSCNRPPLQQNVQQLRSLLTQTLKLAPLNVCNIAVQHAASRCTPHRQRKPVLL